MHDAHFCYELFFRFVCVFWLKNFVEIIVQLGIASESGTLKCVVVANLHGEHFVAL